MTPDLGAAAAASPTDLEVALGTAAVVALVFLIALWAQRTSATPVTSKGWAEVFDDRMAHMEKRQETVEHDVKNIRAALPALPSKDAVHRLEVQVTKLEGKWETVDSKVTSTGASVDRIENYLLGNQIK